MSEKNKTKDHAKAQADLEELGMRPELCLQDTSTKLVESAININKKEKQ